MGGGKDESSSEGFGQNEYSFETGFDDWQKGWMNKLYGNAMNLFNMGMEGMPGLQQGAYDWMDQVGQQGQDLFGNLSRGGAYGDMDLANRLTDSLTQNMASPSKMSEINAMIMGGEGNNYADAMRGQYMQDATDAQNNMMKNLDARASAYNMGGSTGHQKLMSEGMDDINENLQGNLAQLGYETFDKDLNRKLQIAGQADQNTLARENMMRDMLGSQNATMQGAQNFMPNMMQMGMSQFAPFMMPWQMMGNMKGIFGDPILTSKGSGTSSSGSESESKGFSASFL